MVTNQGPTSGTLTTLNTGSYANLGGTGERVLIDYKDAIMDYNVADLPVMGFFADAMSTDTGGNIDITFGRPSMKLEQINEGNTPEYQHTSLRSERVAVKEWGIAIGVTRRMIEDSRFNEVEMALNEARRAVDRHLTAHAVNVVFGIGDATLQTGILAGGVYGSILAASTETGAGSITDFSVCENGGFLGSAATFAGTGDSSRLDDYANQGQTILAAADSYNNDTVAVVAGATGFSLSDVSAAITRMSKHGNNATHMFISPAHYETMLKMADFTSAFIATMTAGAAAGGNVMPSAAGSAPLGSMLSTGGIVGQLYGLTVVVNAWVPPLRIGIFDLSIKPMAYVERRSLTVEEANPGFGIVGSYMSMRYGMKVVRPTVGQIIIG
tara:strand:- start:318 stop:1466 length:1149 start_codon:yes stop_codon:yes gene_type:complete